MAIVYIIVDGRNLVKDMPVPVTHISIFAALSGNIPGGDPTRGIIRPLDKDGDKAKRLSQQVELGLCLHLALSRRCPAVEVKEKRHRGLNKAVRRFSQHT